MSNFMTTKGKADAGRLAIKELKLGANNFRIIGDVLRRYGYWIKTPGGNNVFFESLAFDRDLEKFTNREKDYVPDYFPHAFDFYGNVALDTKTQEPLPHRPKWSYVVTVLDRDDQSAIKELQMKKTAFEGILQLAAKKNPATKKPFGDPTDPVTGWDCNIVKTKTGSGVMNVKYEVDSFSAMSGQCALTEDELQAIEAVAPIFERHPRPTPEEQRALLEDIVSGAYDEKRAKSKGKAASSDAVDDEAVSELGN